MSRRARRAADPAGLGPVVVQLDLFAEQDAADAAERAAVEAAERMAVAGTEVVDTVTLARLCRVEADALEARDRDEQQRLGRGRPSFSDEARRLRGLADWLDERGQEGGQEGGAVSRERVGWPCSRCDVVPGTMCGTHTTPGAEELAFVHCGRGFSVGFTSPGAGLGSRDGVDALANPAPRCTPTCEDGPGGAWRGRCLGCGWRGPIRGRDDGGENTAVEDAHDHTHPGWRDLPVIDPKLNTGSDNPRAQSRAEARWADTAHAAVPAGWFAVGGPVRTRRQPPGARHVPGRAPGGGYDLAAPDQPAAPRQNQVGTTLDKPLNSTNTLTRRCQDR